MLVDILVIGIFIKNCIIGLKRGFLNGIFATFGTMLSLFLSYSLLDNIITLLKNLNIYDRIYSVVNKINFDNISKKLNFIGFSTPNLNFTDIIIRALCLLAVFILIKSIINISEHYLTKILNIKSISSANKILGLTLGFTKGVCLSFIILFVFSTILTIFKVPIDSNYYINSHIYELVSPYINFL